MLNYTHLFLIFNLKFTIKMVSIKRIILVNQVVKNIKLLKRNFYH